MSIAGCPTKRAMPRLILGLINPAYLQVFLPVLLQVKWRGAKPRTPTERKIQLATPPRESVQVCVCV